MAYTVVWFKRDLRVHDHAPLTQAAARGPVLCLYVVEPDLWAQPDMARQHYEFLHESLADLDQALRQRGAALHIATGAMTAVLDRLHALAPFHHLMSHEETGNGASYARDRAVARWCRQHGVTWHEWPQHGVVRRLANRDDWAGHWQTRMQAPRHVAPGRLHGPSLPWASAPPSARALGLAEHDPPQRQRGGRQRGRDVLHEFLHTRSATYRGGISSPLRAPTACSRLSPYLALGCLSLREVVQATRQRLLALHDAPEPAAARQRQGLTAFISRLHWHCHFMQKLESEPGLEFHNLHRGYDGLRDADANPAHLEALMAGRTGWPLVDACVAMLHETGWLNFRMRAMLVSVATYPLWLHWRPVGLWLARQFLDYEPGIHWSQLQMQAGTTGINAMRVYNPLKQARDHDPDGHFVRYWLPALRAVPDTWLAEPWRMPTAVQQRCGVRVGDTIARPLLDLETATRAAKAKVHAVRGRAEVRAAKAAILDKHGSRRPPAARARPRAATPSPQQALNFDPA